MKPIFKLTLAAVLFATAMHAQDIPWDDVVKTGSSLADLTTKSASDLTSGTLPDARFPATLPALNGSLLTALNASNLASGTVPTARLPASTTSATGIIELATNAETLTGTDTTRVVTPAAILSRQLFTGIPPPQYIIDDGVSANRAQVLTPGTIGNVAGLPITVEASVYVPTSNPAAGIDIAYIGGQATGAFSANLLRISILTDGSLTVREYGATTSDTRSLDYAGFRANFSGLPIRLVVSFPEGDSTTNPKITINGTDWTSGFTLSTTGTPPNWLHPSLSTSHILAAYGWPGGIDPEVRCYVGAWSDTEAATWTAGGKRPTWATLAGSAVPSYSQDFASGTDSWTIVSASLTAPVNNAGRLRYEGTASSGTTGVFRPSVFTLGRKYLITATFEVSAALVGRLDYVGIRTLGDLMSSGAPLTGSTPVTLSFIYTPSADHTGGGTRLSFGFGSSSSSIYTSGIGAGNFIWIDDVRIRDLGQIADPIVLPGFAMGDRHGRMSPRLVGKRAVSQLQGGSITQTVSWTGSHEAKSVFGGQVLPANAVVDSITLDPDFASTGSGWTVGNTNDPDQYKTAATFTATPYHYGASALASPFPGGTAASDLDIVVDPDTANVTGSIAVTVTYHVANY